MRVCVCVLVCFLPLTSTVINCLINVWKTVLLYWFTVFDQRTMHFINGVFMGTLMPIISSKFDPFPWFLFYILAWKFSGLCLFCSTGLPGEEERLGFSHFQLKKLENWDEQFLDPSSRVPSIDVIKQEVSQSRNLYGHGREEFQASGPAGSSWSHMVPVSSPRSCVTSLSNNNMLDFTYNKADQRKNQLPDQTSEVIFLIPFFFLFSHPYFHFLINILI